MPTRAVESNMAQDSGGWRLSMTRFGCAHFNMRESWFGKSCIGPNRMLVRYIYSALFFVTVLLAWIVRDYTLKALLELPYLKYCGGDRFCLGSEGVLRVSFGCFFFFLLMYATTVGTSRSSDPRDTWQTGWWPLKILFWLIFMVVPFFMPPAILKFYGELARFGGGIFLLIQLLAVLNFVYWWNEQWLLENNVRQCQVPMLFISIASFVVTVFAVIMMYIWFAPRTSCGLNIFLITWTLILVQVMTSISVHSKVNAGLLTSGIMSLYVVFLCWSALLSEPASESCNRKQWQNGQDGWVTVLGFVLGGFTIVMAAFSTEIGPKSISFQKDENGASDKVPYGYGFFHFVFCLGAMHFLMLFLSWDLDHTIEKWSLDFGWASLWVKIVNEWIAAFLYVWTMVAPLVLEHRDFS